jgi:hypothetical protein
MDVTAGLRARQIRQQAYWGRAALEVLWDCEDFQSCVLECLRDQDIAFRNFFAGRAQHPKFKRKGSAGSLRFQTAWKRGILTLPKLGVLKLAESLPDVDRPDLWRKPRPRSRTGVRAWAWTWD